jgi:dephospho-CoA kinase
MKGGFKLEIWLKRNDQEMTNRLKVKLAEILSDNNDKIKQAYRLTATDFSNFVTHSN